VITDKWLQGKGKDGEWMSDPGPRGTGRLAARITPSGERLFYFRYTDERRVQWRYPIGSYDKHGREGLTLKDARDEAGRLSKLYQSGVRDIRGHEETRKRNDEEQRQADEAARKAAELQAKAGTLRALLTAYWEHLEKLGKPSAADVRRLLKLHVIDAHPALADRRAADLLARDLTPVLSMLVKAGKGRTAAKIRSFIRAACTLALRAETNPRLGDEFRGFALQLNPADALDPLSEYNRPRENNDIKEPDLREYLLALEKLPNAVVRAALESSLYLGGQRAKQLLRVGPADVDMHGREITLRDTKGRRQHARLHKLPLTDRAAELIGEVLKEVLKQNAKAPFVFTNDGKRACTVDTLGKAVAEISAALLKEKKISKRFQLADMRATCETLMARHGIADKDLRAQIQSHGLGGIQARHYDRHDYMPEKRAALERWGQYLDELKAGRRQSKVVAMRKRR
jgi:integrase